MHGACVLAPAVHAWHPDILATFAQTQAALCLHLRVHPRLHPRVLSGPPIILTVLVLVMVMVLVMVLALAMVVVLVLVMVMVQSTDREACTGALSACASTVHSRNLCATARAHRLPMRPPLCNSLRDSTFI